MKAIADADRHLAPSIPSPRAAARSPTTAALIVAGVTFLVWLPCLWNDFVEWDDLAMIIANPRFNPPTVRTVGWYWTHVAWNLYQPLTCTLWGVLAKVGWVNTADQFGGHLNPAVFHLAGVLLHVAAALALLSILRRAVRDDIAAIAGTLVFALHPIQTEAVVFAGVLNNPLFTSLSFIAIDQYLRYTEPADSQAYNTRRRRWHLILGSIALVLAMISKPTAVAVPAIAFVLDLAINHRPWRAALGSIVPWLVLILPCIAWTKRFQHGAVAAGQAPVWFRPFIAGDAAAFYLWKIVYPLHLAIDYGRNPQYVFAHAWGYLTWLAPAALVVLAWRSRRRRPLLAAAIAIFFIALLPNSGLLPFDFQSISTTADRYVYLAMTGVALAIAAAVAELRARHRRVVPFVIALPLLAWIVLAQFQLRTWRDGYSLYRHALALNPNSWLSLGNLAYIEADPSPEQAIADCRRAIQLNPSDAVAYNTLGSVLMQRGDHAAALDAFATAHQLEPDDALFALNYQRAVDHGRGPSSAR